MQLRGRNADGRAVTAKDGLIKEFETLFEGLDDKISTESVKGGDIYYMKNATSINGKPLVKLVKYDTKSEKAKKIPKFQDNYTKVDALVGAVKSTGGTSDAQFKEIRAIRKLHVETLKTIDDAQFKKILKKHQYINDDSTLDNTTDHKDLEKFVDAAIAKYQSVHNARPISLADIKYKKYINKVLMKVREQYLPEESGIASITWNTDAQKIASIYTFWDKSSNAKVLEKDANKLGAVEIAAHNKVATTAYNATAPAAADLRTYILAKSIITPKVLDDAKAALGTATTQDKTGEAFKTGADQLMVFTPLLADASPSKSDLVALKELIEYIYDLFIERTKKMIKEKPELVLDFKDGGKTKSKTPAKKHRTPKKTKNPVAPVPQAGRSRKNKPSRKHAKKGAAKK
jgi:hypothetical protein